MEWAREENGTEGEGQEKLEFRGDLTE